MAETCPGVLRRAGRQPRQPSRQQREAAATVSPPAATAADDDAPHETQPAPCLPGSPELPFHTRLSMQRADQNLLKLILLVRGVDAQGTATGPAWDALSTMVPGSKRACTR